MGFLFINISFAEGVPLVKFGHPYIVEMTLDENTPDSVTIDFIRRSRWKIGCHQGGDFVYIGLTDSITYSKCRVPKTEFEDDEENITVEFDQSSSRKFLTPQSIRITISMDDKFGSDYSARVEFVTGPEDDIEIGMNGSLNPRLTLIGNFKEVAQVYSGEENKDDATIGQGIQVGENQEGTGANRVQ